MKRALALTFAALAIATPAGAAERSLRVDQVERFTTPQRFAPDDVVLIRVFVNGREVRDTAYSSGRVAGWARAGVIVEAQASRSTGPIRFRIANARRRDARVRIQYGRYEPATRRLER